MSTFQASDLIDRKALAAHVLRRLARAHALGRLVRLDELAADIGVPRSDLRSVITSLHAEGHVDAMRMALTMSGLVIATSMYKAKLRDVRPTEEFVPESRVA